MIKSICLVIIFFTGSALAQISPGKLAQPHAHLEGISNCTRCHTLGGGPDMNKCLKCHGEIKLGLKLKKGYHALILAENEKKCFTCHGDHNGRNFKLIFWPQGMEYFDHAKTGFYLEGKHRTIKCEACHQPKNIVHEVKKLNENINLKRTFLGLDPACLSCHQDEHQGQLSKACTNCHEFTGWKPAVKFSHDKARFRLTGKHQKLLCEKCHPDVPLPLRAAKKTGKAHFTKFVGLPFSNCTGCHKDVHRSKFGQNCQRCHDTFGWRRIISDDFDHSLTRFPLIGLHKRVTCEKCHVGGKVKTSMRFANCTDCHKDAHFGQFSSRPDRGRCEACHDVFGFIPANYGQEEHLQSIYPLTGSHLAVPCVSCHFILNPGTKIAKRIFKFQDKTCNGCHADVHKGQFARYLQKDGCESCHQTTMWEQTTFDHNQARFPLLGKHRAVACRKCHKRVDVNSPEERILFRPMKMNCSDCHKDVHQGQFAKREGKSRCEKCHHPESWTALLFDHNRDALFKLRGGHENVPCAECHKTYRKGKVQFVLYKPIDRRCVNCHGNK